MAPARPDVHRASPAARTCSTSSRGQATTPKLLRRRPPLAGEALAVKARRPGGAAPNGFTRLQHYALPARDNIGLGRHQHIDDLTGIMLAARPPPTSTKTPPIGNIEASNPGSDPGDDEYDPQGNIGTLHTESG
jgi:hypothetical protein